MIPNRMKALVLHGIGDLRLEEVPVPPVPDDGLLVRVAWCGVCGSDLPRIFSTGAHRMPLIPGHEFSGVVAGVGKATGGWRIGQPVVVFPLLWCGRCHACYRGHYAQCTDYDYLGSRRNGAFAEYVACPERNARPVPAGVPLAWAALTEPAAVALHALRRASQPIHGSSVAVFGAGPIGLLVAQWARIMGALRILLFDIVEGRLQTARSLGFAHVFNNARDEPPAAVRVLTGGPGADVCVEAAGVPATAVACMECVRPGGTVVLLGNPSADVVVARSTVSALLRKEANIAGVWNSVFLPDGDDEWQAVLDAMASRELQVEPLISQRVSLAEGLDMLQAMASRRIPFGKVLIGRAHSRPSQSDLTLPDERSEH